MSQASAACAAAVRPGIHLLQEDSAPQIGHALAEWIKDPSRPPAP